MVDILGPGGNATNVVTSRPADTRTFPASDTWFKDCSSPTANDGTIVPAATLNALMAQLRTVIRTAGITDDNTNDSMLLQAIRNVAPGRNVQVYSTAGTYTFTVPAGVTSIYGEVWGAGGGSTRSIPGAAATSMAQGGGAGGGYAAGWISVTPGQTITITVGAGGVGRTYADNTSSPALAYGGTSSIGAFMSATGGQSASGTETVGGTGSGGQVNRTGGPGHDAVNNGSTSTNSNNGYLTIGLGGQAGGGGGAAGNTRANTTSPPLGGDGVWPGGGGTAGGSSAGAGADGGVILRY